MTPAVQGVRVGVRAVLAFVFWCGTLALGQPSVAEPDAPYAAVRVLRAGASDEPLDVWLGQTRVATEVATGGPSGYVIVSAGRHEVGLAVAGDDASAGPSSTVGHVDVVETTYATLVVPDLDAADREGRAQGDEARTPPFLLDDPLVQLPPVGEAALRLVHVAPQLPPLRALAVRRGEEGVREAEPPGQEDSSGPTRYEARVNPMRGTTYATVEAGTYRVWLDREGGEAVLPEPLEVSLRGGALHTVVVASGRSQSADVVVSVDATGVHLDQGHGGESALLRLVHASPDAPLVDVLVDGALSLRDVAPGAATSYAAVPTGRHIVEVYPHRLPGSTLVPGASSASENASSEGGDNAAERSPPDGRERPASVPRLDPVTALVDVPAGQYTTLVLAGRYEPAGESAERGGLSVAVEPEDAEVTVQGPEGNVVASEPGPKLLDGLATGTYRIEVRKEGFRSAGYEVDVQADTTSVVSVTLQQSPGPSASDDGEAGGEEDGQRAAPDFVNAAASQGERRSLELQVYASHVPIAAPGSARVRFVHAAPSIPDLEIIASRGPAGGDDGDSSEVVVASIERMAYPNASEYIEIESGEIVLTFRLAGSRNRLRRLDPLPLRPGLSYTLYLVARDPSLRFGIVPTVDAIAPQRVLGEGQR